MQREGKRSEETGAGDMAKVKVLEGVAHLQTFWLADAKQQFVKNVFRYTTR